MKPRLLDLYCGAGGAAKGYADCGFEVTGVDIRPQANYPFPFIQDDALEYLPKHGLDYDAYHASPPCQGYSIMRNLPWLKDKEYPMLIESTRELLNETGKPWVIENVMGAKLAAGFLCGTMFGKRFYRHRAFEANWLWLSPPHLQHRVTIKPYPRDNRNFVCPDEVPPTGVVHPGRLINKRARKIVFSDTEDSRGIKSWPGRRTEGGHGLTTWSENGIAGGVAHTAGIRAARAEMECDWMTRYEVTQAIPPCYTRFIGAQLMKWLEK